MFTPVHTDWRPTSATAENFRAPFQTSRWRICAKKILINRKKNFIWWTPFESLYTVCFEQNFTFLRWLVFVFIARSPPITANSWTDNTNQSASQPRGKVQLWSCFLYLTYPRSEGARERERCTPGTAAPAVPGLSSSSSEITQNVGFYTLKNYYQHLVTNQLNFPL